MPIEINDDPATNLVTITLTGKLIKHDHREFGRRVDAAITRAGKARILLLMRDFRGWNAGAAWEGVKFDVRHFSDIEKLAMVGDAKWQQRVASLWKPFNRAKIKYFNSSDMMAASAWLHHAEPSQLVCHT